MKLGPGILQMAKNILSDPTHFSHNRYDLLPSGRKEGGTQGFMQDQIIASHMCFGGHVDVTVKLVYKLSNCA